MDTVWRHRWWTLALVGALVAVVATLVWVGSRGDASQHRAVETTPSRSDDPTAVVTGRRIPEAERVPRQQGDPRRILIPDLGVDAPEVPIAAPGGVLTPPAGPPVIGWWADGARPGQARGSALVTGHTVSTGGGALDDLEQLGRGDPIRVSRARGRTAYRVRSVQVLDKGELAERAEEIFDQGVAGRLVVVTCEDWDGEEYLSNVVVTATPVTSR